MSNLPPADTALSAREPAGPRVLLRCHYGTVQDYVHDVLSCITAILKAQGLKPKRAHTLADLTFIPFSAPRSNITACVIVSEESLSYTLSFDFHAPLSDAAYPLLEQYIVHRYAALRYGTLQLNGSMQQRCFRHSVPILSCFAEDEFVTYLSELNKAIYSLPARFPALEAVYPVHEDRKAVLQQLLSSLVELLPEQPPSHGRERFECAREVLGTDVPEPLVHLLGMVIERTDTA